MSYKLKDIRIDNDLTQKQIADKLGVSRSTYSGWENEEDNIPLYQFNNFCELFDMSLDYVSGITNRSNDIKNKVKKTIDTKLIGKNLEFIRKKFKLTGKELAHIMGVSPATYVNYKNGQTCIQTEILKKTALHFNISLDWILGKSKNKYI